MHPMRVLLPTPIMSDDQFDIDDVAEDEEEVDDEEEENGDDAM